MVRSRTTELPFKSISASYRQPGSPSDKAVRSGNSGSVKPVISTEPAGSKDVGVAQEIRMLCAENARHGTAYTSAAQAAARSIEKVIRAESYLRDAAISLGQEEEMATLINELYEVGGALRDCCGKVSDKRVSDRAERARQAESHARDIDSIKPALPQWWFALSEMLQVTEREIEFLKTIGRGQPRESEARRLCNLVIRVLRRHYQSMLAEADEWMSAADV